MARNYALIVGLTGLLVCVFGTAAWACDALGPNRHLGVVTEVEPESGTFTVMDAQLRKPVTFTASPRILERVKVNEQVVVAFRVDDKHRMRAEFVLPAEGGPQG